jgi:hypothetical protein
MVYTRDTFQEQCTGSTHEITEVIVNSNKDYGKNNVVE